MFNVIVWASDGSENADHALDYARQLAQANSSKLIAVHVKESLVERWAGYPIQVDEEQVTAKVERQAAELQGDGIDASYERLDALAGGAAHVVAELAKERGAELIVVGTRGRGPVMGLILGSVTQRLLHVASCPVLAVPPTS